MFLSRMFLSFSLLFSCLVFASADEVRVPTADLKGTKEPANLSRFAGSVLLSYEYFDYDEMDVPLTMLKRDTALGRDANSNQLYFPEKAKTLTGKHSRLIYAAPANASPLQVMRNYQNEAKANSGKILFECKNTSCGGDSTRAYLDGGGVQGVPKYLWPAKKITAPYNSLLYCAQDGWLSDLQYSVIELPNINRFLSIVTYQFSDNACKALINRTFVIVDVFESGAMNQTMAIVSSGEIANSIKAQGHIALYGIHFDSGKSEINADSAEALAQIAKALKEQPNLKLIVAGHTDNDGTFEANMVLSKARADAVVNVLVQKYAVAKTRLRAVGLSFASPLASNKTNEGKAQNRRVELVEE